MAITIFVLLFSIGLLSVLTVLLHTKKIPPVVFAALIALLTVFDYALLSLDKIYYLHEAQDQAIKAQVQQQKEVIGQLTSVQLDITLQLLSQVTAQDNEQSIQQKIQWRDRLLAQLRLAKFNQVKIDNVEQQVNQSVHVYLMEQLNKQMVQSLGHRIYRDFVRIHSSKNWTDDLFIQDLKAYLKKEELDKPEVTQAMHRVTEFDKTGDLLLHNESAL